MTNEKSQSKGKATGVARARQTAVPQEMQAAAIAKFGPPNVLELRTLAVPQPGPQDVLIEVHGAGVGIWDAFVSEGDWLPKGQLVPGIDGAGVVVARGTQAQHFALGDQVYGYSLGGFYAQYNVVTEDSVAHIPRGFDMLHAAAAPVPGLTALQGIEDHLQVKSEEVVLIVGGTGSVGSVAIQLAHAKDARVIATASSAEARKFAHNLGADYTIDARSPDALEQLRAIVPEGIDAALVLFGGANVESLLGFVKAGGRIAYPNGVEPPPKERPNVRITAYDGKPGKKEFAELERAIEEAKLEVPIAAVYDLAQAPEAHKRILQGNVLGRIVLRI